MDLINTNYEQLKRKWLGLVVYDVIFLVGANSISTITHHEVC